MKTITVTELKSNLRDILDEIKQKEQIIYVENYRKKEAALVPIKYAKILEAIIQNQN